MESVADLINLFGGVTRFSEVIGKGVSTASEMKRSGSIAVEHWPKIIAAASERGIDGVTAEFLMGLHADGAAR